MKETLGKGASTYQLYMKLKYTSPPLWRRLKIRGDFTLAELHSAIQCLMDWKEEHLHVFEIGEKEYGNKNYGAEIDEKRVKVEKALKGISEFTYRYDFRSEQVVKINVEEILPEEDLPNTMCTGGQRPGPGETEMVWDDEEEIPTRSKRRPPFDPDVANACIRSWTPNPLMQH